MQHPKIANNATTNNIISRQCSNVSTKQCLLCFWWLPSVCQASNRRDFKQWSKIISKISEDDVQVPPVFVALGRHKQLQSYCRNAPNVFNQRQIWRIWRPINQS